MKKREVVYVLEKPRGNSFAVAGFAMSLASMVAIFIPFFNLMFTVAATLTSLVGLVVAFRRDGRGLGFAVPGLIFSVIFLCVSWYSTGFLLTAMRKSDKPPVVEREDHFR